MRSLQVPKLPWQCISRWIYKVPRRKPKSLDVCLQAWVKQFESKAEELALVDALLLDFRLAPWVDPVTALVLITSMSMIIGSAFEGRLGLRATALDVTWAYRMGSLLGLDFLVSPIMETEGDMDAWLSFRRAQTDPKALRVYFEYAEASSGLAVVALPNVMGFLSGRFPRLGAKSPVLDGLLIRLSAEELQINEADLDALAAETGIPWGLSGGTALKHYHGSKIMPIKSSSHSNT